MVTMSSALVTSATPNIIQNHPVLMSYMKPSSSFIDRWYLFVLLGVALYTVIIYDEYIRIDITWNTTMNGQ